MNKEHETKEELTSVFKGSRANYLTVKAEIKQRFGKEAGQSYDPRKNCFSYVRWQQEGRQVKRGEKAIKSTTWISVIDKDDPTKISKFPRKVNLFHVLQTELIKERAVA